jgi:hypothetical protein
MFLQVRVIVAREYGQAFYGAQYAPMARLSSVTGAAVDAAARL